jgi:hypothetical protein
MAKPCGFTIQIWHKCTIKPFEENYSKTPAMLFAGNAAVISQQFTVEKIGQCWQGFRLLPKNKQRDLFESLEMTFLKNVPVSMTILDAMQQKTTIYFSKVVVNPVVSAISSTLSHLPVLKCCKQKVSKSNGRSVEPSTERQQLHSHWRHDSARKHWIVMSGSRICSHRAKPCVK